MKIDGSTLPNWMGTEQKRTLAVIGDELTVAAPATAAGGGVTTVWKRVD